MAAAEDYPGPGLLGLPGLLAATGSTETVELARTLQRRYGYLVAVPPLPGLGDRAFLVSHPDDVERVLRSEQTLFGKPDNKPLRDFRHVMGEGLVASEGELWLRQTRMIQPMLQRDSVARYLPVFREETGAMLDRWQARQRAGEPIPLMASMKHLTARIMGRALFGDDDGEHDVAIRDALETLRAGYRRRRRSVLPTPLWIPTPSNRRLHDARDQLRGAARAMVNDHLGAADGRDVGGDAGADDFLSRMLEAKDPVDGGGMSITQVQDEVVSFVVAAHETTATALTWTLARLARHDDHQRAVRREIAAAERSDAAGLAALDALDATERVFDEVLRLYPPIPMTGRTTTEPVTLHGHELPAGEDVVVPFYAMHRDPAFWDDPVSFDPGRFRPERAEDRHDCAYLPFSTGGHACSGQEFARIEALAVLSELLGETGVAREDDRPVGIDAGVNLQPDREIELRLR